MSNRKLRLTEKQKIELLLAYPECWICHEKIGPLTGVQFDHTLPIGLDGADAIENLRPVHIVCHQEKTADDMRKIRKANRLRRGPKQSKRKIPSRPLPKRKVKGE